MTLKYATLVALLAAFATPAPALCADYKIDTDNAHASITFKVNHLGFSWIIGRFD